MRVYYYIVYVLNALLALLFIFAGSSLFERRIFKTGFYEDTYDKNALAAIWNVSPDTALLISQFFAVILFLSLLFILLSIIIRRWVDKDKITVIVLVLFLVIAIILFGIPVKLFK